MLRAVSVMFFPLEGNCGKMPNKYPINGALIDRIFLTALSKFSTYPEDCYDDFVYFDPLWPKKPPYFVDSNSITDG